MAEGVEIYGMKESIAKEVIYWGAVEIFGGWSSLRQFKTTAKRQLTSHSKQVILVSYIPNKNLLQQLLFIFDDGVALNEDNLDCHSTK